MQGHPIQSRSTIPGVLKIQWYLVPCGFDPLLRDHLLDLVPNAYWIVAVTRVTAVERHFAVDDVTARGKKLHHLVPGAGQLRPARAGLRVLLQSAQSLALEDEVDFAETLARRVAYGKSL